MKPIDKAIDSIIEYYNGNSIIDHNELEKILLDFESEISELFSVNDMAQMVGVSPTIIRRLHNRDNIGKVIAGKIMFTSQDGELLKARNKSRGNPKGKPRASVR